MKIVHIHWGLDTGGTENMLVDIINQQVNYEDVSAIIINDAINKDIVNKISPKCHLYFCRRQIKSRNILPFMRLNYYLFRIKPDVVHVHAPGIVRFIIGNYIKVRTIHSTLNTNNEYHRFKALYAISDAVRDFTAKQGFSAVTVANGINVSAICTSVGVKKNEGLKVIQVSRLNHQDKGQDILIKAFAVLREKGITGIELYFIGDGPSREYLLKLVQKYNLSSCVHFEGNKSREYIYQNLCNFDLFVQPSRNEGFGLTIAEAMAAKIPVLVSDVEGPMEVIKKGEYGYFFKTGDVQDCAEKIYYAITTDNKELVEKAYEYISGTYDVKFTAKRYIDEYKKLLSE